MKRISTLIQGVIHNMVMTSFAFLAIVPITRGNFFRAEDPSPFPIEGRWDITVHQGGKEVPSWLEIQRSGERTLVGRFVGGGGSARPISKISYSDGKMSF